MYGTLAKLHTGCVNYDPTCTNDRGYVFIGNASLSVMCGIFALLHKLKLALVSDNLFLRSVMPVVYCKFVSSGRGVAYYGAVRDTTPRHNLRATRLLLDFLSTGADKSLARPGRKQAIATEEFDVHISYLLS